MPILVWDETELRGGKPVLRKQSEAKRPLDYRLLGIHNDVKGRA